MAAISKDAAFLLTVGGILLTAEHLCLQLCFGTFWLTIGAFLLTVELLCLQWELRLISTSIDCKQRSSSASRKAPIASKKASPDFKPLQFQVASGLDLKLLAIRASKLGTISIDDVEGISP